MVCYSRHTFPHVTWTHSFTAPHPHTLSQFYHRCMFIVANMKILHHTMWLLLLMSFRDSSKKIYSIHPLKAKLESTSWRDWYQSQTPTSWTSSAQVATPSPPFSPTLRLLSSVDPATLSCANQPVVRPDWLKDALSEESQSKLIKQTVFFSFHTLFLYVRFFVWRCVWLVLRYIEIRYMPDWIKIALTTTQRLSNIIYICFIGELVVIVSLQ